MQESGMEFMFEPESMESFRRWLLEKESSEATIAKYGTDLKTFRRYLGEDLLVTKERLLRYKKWLTEEYALSSVNSMLAALNQYLEFSGRGNMKVKRVKIQTRMFAEKSRELNKKEYRMLNQAAKNRGKASLALMLEGICATGIRVSELAFLTVDSVKRGEITINNKGKVRVILLPEPLRKKLLYYIRRKGIQNGPVFVTRNGNPKDRSNIWKEMKQLAQEAGVDPAKVFPHNLRHLFARTFYQTTGDLSGLADILGHSNLSVTRIYTKESGERYRRQIESLGLIFL